MRSPAPDFGLAFRRPEASRRLQVRGLARRSAESLPSRVLEPGLAVSFRAGTGLHPERFRRQREPGRAIRICSTGSPRNSLRTAGALKGLHRLIVTSETYRQTSDFRPDAAAIDADNQLLWRFPPRRLEGEAVRDAMLSVSGN